jgi:O-antigen ligase
LLLLPKQARKGLFLDPLFSFALLLNILLFIQWRNAGGTLFLNMITAEYSITPPPLEGWPFSVEAGLSRQQLAWFAPAGLLAIAARHLFSCAVLKGLLWGLLLNAAVMAGFGLVQYALGWTRMFGWIEIPGNPHLIASFDYPNHGGSFFYLLYAVAIGLFFDALEKKKNWKQITLPGVLAVLFGLTALASLSRAAVLAVLAITIGAVVLWVLLHHKSFNTGSWVNLLFAGGVLSVVFVLGLISIGDGAVLREFTGSDNPSDEQRLTEYYTENRGYQIPPALEMVEDHPWFGVGGWGYRRFIRLYLNDEDFAIYLGTGKANVHCDPVQFLAEHGWVGFGLMSAGLGTVLYRWRRLRDWRFKGLPLMTLTGCAVVLLHSLIDLPFRCPTVLWLWLFLLAAVPLLAGNRPSRATLKNA